MHFEKIPQIRPYSASLPLPHLSKKAHRPLLPPPIFWKCWKGQVTVHCTSTPFLAVIILPLLNYVCAIFLFLGGYIAVPAALYRPWIVATVSTMQGVRLNGISPAPLLAYFSLTCTHTVRLFGWIWYVTYLLPGQEAINRYWPMDRHSDIFASWHGYSHYTHTG